ncbi:F0F1 ATP synthase subunit A [Ruania alba]|uniref:F0F1 ATP synthase subunit A n=1 Tax=Ruania alba TaxID=648782 RepID=UPI002481DF0F|nr:F0F1 ATP synthase subunit A [Ruania alba]
MEEFFPDAIFGAGTFLEFDRIIFVRLVIVAILLLLLWLGVRKAKLVPGRGQSILELSVDFVRVQIAEQVMGVERARPFVPMLTAIFFIVLTMNLAGLVPGLNIAGTSRIGIPLLLALWVFIVYLSAGVRKQGLGGYLKSQLFPPGVPWPMYFLLTPIEILQVFILRPATLALRLVANMMAGHFMMILALAATNFLLLEGAGVLKGLSILTFAGGIFIFLFELMVAFLQTYIFVLLSSIYLNFALEEEH